MTRAERCWPLRCIVEGNSIRSAARITGLDKKTIIKLVCDAGERCEALLDAKIRNVPVSDVQADEIWGFVGKKEGHKNPFEGDDMYLGDAWCFIGIERHTKLVLAFELGKRTETSAGPIHGEVGRCHASGTTVPVDHGRPTAYPYRRR